MSPPDSTATRALLEESAWLQRLARRLVAEPSQAEDAAQDALVVGLEHPPEAMLTKGVPVRRWLAGVLRNLVRQDRRGAARRAAREQAWPIQLEAEAADELAARLELQERLVARVRALDEPYRTTIALRFLADLSTHEVAARMDVAAKTVHTRIERALAKLREDLDREHGGRTAWAGLLLPLSMVPPSLSLPAPPAAGPSLLAPLLAMGTLWKWTGAAAALALVGLVVVQLRGEPATHESASVTEAPAAPVLAQAATPTLEGPPNRAREALAAEAPSAAHAPARGADASVVSPPPRIVSGRVIDVEHRGLPGLEVRFEPTSFDERLAAEPSAQARTTSGAQGAFELPLPVERGRLLASGKGYATLLASALDG